MANHTVAIVGAGLSGTLLAVHLLRQVEMSHIILIEREHAIGRGVAYSTCNLNHRLNVTAERMSAFVDDPYDFLHWLNSHGYDCSQGEFMPRWLFGCYIRQRLGEAMRNAPGRLEIVSSDVNGIRFGAAGGLSLRLASGRVVDANQVALAMGNRPPHCLPVAEAAFLGSSYYCGDPWAPAALTGLDPHATVLLIGTGLTMVDVVVSLLDAGHRGSIQAISRRGLLPHTHAPAPPKPFVAAEKYPSSLASLLQRLRRDARDAAEHGTPWQAVMDCVRHHVQEIWCAASEADRQRFLRHGRIWWDIHRHRIPPAVAARIDEARRTGQLRIAAGRINALTAGTNDADIAYTPRGSTKPLQVRAARVINCTGPAGDITRSDDALLRSLLAERMAQPDKLRLGLDVTQSGEVVGADGAITPGLFAVGPLTKAALWETTAVPDVRQGCINLAAFMSRQTSQRTPVTAA